MEIFSGKADLHIHSKYGYDSFSSIKSIFQAADKKNLDVIALTDHNTIKGWSEAKKIASEFKVDFVQGEEIDTKQGHLIGLFINSLISPGKPVLETIKEIHQQGGLAIAPHPCSFFQKGIPLNVLFKIYQDLDGIEFFNSSSYLLNWFSNKKIIKSGFQKLNIANIGSSDAHVNTQVGAGYTLFKGKSSSDLFYSIKNKEIEAHDSTNFSSYFKLIISQPTIFIKRCFFSLF